MAEAVSYEEQRQRQIAENKRKLEELQLHHLSAAVREAAAAAKKRKPRAPRAAATGPHRRSGRVASLPDKPDYREVKKQQPKAPVPRAAAATEPLGPLRRSGRVANLAEKPQYIEVAPDATDEERSYAISKAEELEEELGTRVPVFVQPITESHVTGGFWLGLPTDFCRKHLPKRDETITLVDEDDDEYDTLYVANKRGLSAGWRGFAIDHKLVDGDCLVFQLIEPTKFKVYIIRAGSYYESDD